MQKKSRTFFIGLALAAILGSIAAVPQSLAATATPAQFAPNDRHAKVSRLVTTFIERRHYSRARVDDELSVQMFSSYIDALDGNRIIFYAGDIEEFKRYEEQLDDAVRRGQMQPVFDIFNVFHARNRDRIEYSLSLLDQEPDFSIDEEFEFDRTDAEWIVDKDEMDEIWRKRVKNDALRLELTEKTWEESKEILRKRYERGLRGLDQIKDDDVFEVFMNSYARTLDPHSSYLSPRNSEEYRIQMSLSYEGIGASLQLEDDYVIVLNIIAGGPAAIDGQLAPNDRITAVGQEDGDMVDVIGWRLDDVVQLIRGPGGTIVRLQILAAGATPGSEEKILELGRDRIKLEAQAAQKDTVTVPRGDKELRIGVITVPSFYQDFNARVAGDKDYTSTTRDVERLVHELENEGVDGIVLDLRGNGGGHLSEARDLSGLFIERGPVVQLRSHSGTVEVLRDQIPSSVFPGPLAVLVNRYSASASEIFAAAIQDYGRGVVIGQQTFGKGSVQNLYSLDRYVRQDEPGFGQLTLTIGKYYRVTGDSTQHRGVLPDIALPSIVDPAVVGESSRDHALPWDQIKSVDHDAEVSLDGAIDVLAREHTVRASDNPDFDFIISDIEAFDLLREQKTVSLNLEKRRIEREQQNQNRLERENTRRVAHDLEPLASIEELETQESPDYLLQEAAEIVADMVGLGLPQTAASFDSPNSGIAN